MLCLIILEILFFYFFFSFFFRFFIQSNPIQSSPKFYRSFQFVCPFHSFIYLFIHSLIHTFTHTFVQAGDNQAQNKNPRWLNPPVFREKEKKKEEKKEERKKKKKTYKFRRLVFRDQVVVWLSFLAGD